MSKNGYESPPPPGDGKGSGDGRWICKQEVKHWRSGKMMRRKDGKPFRFMIKNKKKG